MGTTDLFHKIDTETGEKIFFCTHVDDVAIAVTNSELIEELCVVLKTEYIVTESNTMESFLGVNMQRENGHLYLSQPGLIAKMVKKAGLPASGYAKNLNLYRLRGWGALIKVTN